MITIKSGIVSLPLITIFYNFNFRYEGQINLEKLCCHMYKYMVLLISVQGLGVGICEIVFEWDIYIMVIGLSCFVGRGWGLGGGWGVQVWLVYLNMDNQNQEFQAKIYVFWVLACSRNLKDRHQALIFIYKQRNYQITKGKIFIQFFLKHHKDLCVF